MRIAVLGANGTVGKLLVKLALEAGHEVVAYVRRADAMPGLDRLAVVQAPLEDTRAMRAAFSGSDAVVSCLGVRAGVFGMRAPIDFQQRALPIILDAIEDAGVPRFVLLTSFGAGDTAMKASRFARCLIYHGIARGLFEDKGLSEAALNSRDLSWAALYPVTLYDAPMSDDVALVPLSEVDAVPGLPRLPYVNVASVLLELALVEEPTQKRFLLTTQNGWRAASSAA